MSGVGVSRLFGVAMSCNAWDRWRIRRACVYVCVYELPEACLQKGLRGANENQVVVSRFNLRNCRLKDTHL